MTNTSKIATFKLEEKKALTFSYPLVIQKIWLYKYTSPYIFAVRRILARSQKVFGSLILVTLSPRNVYETGVWSAIYPVLLQA